MTEKTIELGFGPPSVPFFENAGKRKAIHIASKYIQIQNLECAEPTKSGIRNLQS